MSQRLTRETLATAARALAQRDDDLARILTRLGTPPLWSRRPGFPTLVRIILEQQVTLASARALFRRLQGGVRPFTARRFVELGEAGLRSLGATRQKAAACLALARALAGRQLILAAVGRLDDSAARAALVQIKGIGPWTAEIYLLMALRRLDIWPSGDLALVAAVGRLKGLAGRPTPGRAARIAERWRPFRSVAARMLWQYYLAGRRERAPEAAAEIRRGDTRPRPEPLGRPALRPPGFP